MCICLPTSLIYYRPRALALGSWEGNRGLAQSDGSYCCAYLTNVIRGLSANCRSALAFFQSTSFQYFFAKITTCWVTSSPDSLLRLCLRTWTSFPDHWKTPVSKCRIRSDQYLTVVYEYTTDLELTHHCTLWCRYLAPNCSPHRRFRCEHHQTSRRLRRPAFLPLHRERPANWN